MMATTTARPDLTSHAVTAADRDWRVFPVRPEDKRPACDRWEQRASADPELVRRYWPSPRHNVGIACGPSGLVVVDLDPPDGIEMFGLLCRNHRHRPQTYTVRTPRDGLHLYFLAVPGREIRNSASRIGPNIDIRAAGGFVLAAGSVVNGQPYEVTDERDPVPLPPWIADLADPPRPSPASRPRPCSAPSHPDAYAEAALRGEAEAVRSAPVGQRNHQLNVSSFRLGQLAAGGVLTEGDVLAAMLAAAEACGLLAEDGRAKCERTIRSGLTAGVTQPRGRG